MNTEELMEIVKLHGKYILGDPSGAKANLHEAYLEEAELQGVDLQGADFSIANLRRADLRDSNLRGARLAGANLEGVGLNRADLQGADLRGVYLHEANLQEANLQEADLQRAELQGADLQGANLQGANFKDTVLDPKNIPNGCARNFKTEGEYIIGYRTRKSRLTKSNYADGIRYEVAYFSTCNYTRCHPGLYIFPSIENVVEFIRWVEYYGRDIIKVRTKAEVVHRVTDKWRCKWFEVIGSVPVV